MNQIQFHQEVEAPPIISEGLTSSNVFIPYQSTVRKPWKKKRRKSSKLLRLLIQVTGIVLGGLTGIYLGGLVVELWVKPLLSLSTT